MSTEKAGDGSLRLVCSGEWRNGTVTPVLEAVQSFCSKPGTKAAEIDIAGISSCDTTGAWLIRRMMIEAMRQGAAVRLEGGRQTIQDLILALPDAIPGPPSSTGPKGTLFERMFAPLGVVMVDLWKDVLAALSILGSAVRGAQLKLGRSSGVSPAAIINQIDHMGVRAVPIIVLMSFLIGAIIAQQGAFQLRYFGAEVFVVDLVGILQLREIGVLLTAIMIAGRSGSAITAEIGSMKMREEVDALKVIGLNPIGVLVFPRLVALTVALPLLTIIANFAALAGAAVVAWLYSGITFEVFQSRLNEAIEMSTIASGMIKAPFMALVIGIVAAVEGMKVGGSAESLGRQVTASVVKSIFVVILMDGLFAMFYAAIDF
ncbi:ABC transporter permease [Rhizobiaceae bacterium BDR2-2]|uniref:ABC transporter permease n=2 Tax=Ectorhizobium quercum TaxID=2965071 RepID=A0AAE3MYG4_9HYPH|nr:ABC transporter permease [Ectorhizobium quercum]MCX8997533.1 ABC transporter permease [Ectorhizobium quercum]